MSRPTDVDEDVRRFRRLETAFRRLRDLSEADRARPLARIRREDPQLHAELLALLEHDPGATGDGLASDDGDACVGVGRFEVAESLLREISPTESIRPGGGSPDVRRVGPYRLIRELGVGSSGVVHLAADERNGREVALKLLHGLVAGPVALARFRREAAILQRLEHPGIARILEADAVDGPAGPQCYIAMEPVDGVPVTRWANAAKLDTRAILELLAEIADAVAHAHARGVVHRDLKPANLLVSADGRPRVLDLGAATLDRPEGTGHFTETGQVIGTVPYMAPEQFEGVFERIGPPCDVYALGVLAYRLLVGRLPLDIAGRPLAEAARIARDEEPSTLGSVDRRLRGPISAVIGTALEKDPRRRYPDAAALAADLRRTIRGESVVARPPTRLELLRRAARRNRRLLGTTVAAFAVLAAGLVVAVTIAVSADRVRRQETLDRRDAEQRRVEADTLRALADVERDEAIRQAAAASLAAAESAVRSSETGEARRQLDRVRPALRGWTWDHLAGRIERSDGPPVSVDDPLGLNAVHVVDERTVAMAAHGVDGRVHVVRDGLLAASWPAAGWINAIERGPTLDTVLVGGHRGVELLDLTDGTRQPLLGWGDSARTLHLLPDDRTVVVGGTAGHLAWCDLTTGTRLGELRISRRGSIHLVPAGSATRRPAFAAPETAAARPVAHGTVDDAEASRAAAARLGATALIAVIENHGGLLVGLDPAGRPAAEILWEDDRMQLARAAGNQRGDTVASSWGDGSIRVRRGPDWSETVSWRAANGHLNPLLMMPDDSVVLGGSDSLSWWSADGRLRRRMAGHADRPRDLAHLGDGRLISVAFDGTLRRWDLLAPDEPAVLPHPRQARRVAFTGDGRTVVTGGGRHPTRDGLIRTWDAADGRQLTTFEHSLTEVHEMLICEDPLGDGQCVVAAGVGVAAWDPQGGPPRWIAVPTWTVWAMVDPGDGTIVAIGYHGNVVRLDLEDGSVLAEGQLQIDGCEAVGIGDGTMLVLGRRPGEHATRWLRVEIDSLAVLGSRDPDHGDPRDSILLPDAWIVAGSDGPDAPRSPQVAVAHSDGSVQIIDPRTLESVAEIPDAGLEPGALGILRKADGSWRLLVAGHDRLLRFFVPGETRAFESMLVHDLPVSDLAVSPDGGMIATSSVDRTARIWRRHSPSHRVVPDPVWPEAAPSPSWSDDRTVGGPIADRLRTWFSSHANALPSPSGG